MQKQDELEKQISELEEKKDVRKIKEIIKENQYSFMLELSNESQFLRFKEINSKEKVLYMLLLSDEIGNYWEEDVICLVPIDNLLYNSKSNSILVFSLSLERT